MPTRPNAPAPQGYSNTFGPDLTPEADMALTTDPLDVDGDFSVRVDCNCNAYSKEVVTIPNVVIFDALMTLEEGDNARTVLARTMGDRRITSAKTADPSNDRPGPDFTVTHLAQAANALRARRHIPFTPFAGNAWHLTQTMAVFTEWADRYRAATGELVGFEVTQAPLETTVAVGPEGITGYVTQSQAPGEVLPAPGYQGPAIDMEDLGAQLAEAEEVGAGYPDPPGAKEVIAWVGDSYPRAVFAWSIELDRGDDIRKTVRAHCDSLGVDVG